MQPVKTHRIRFGFLIQKSIVIMERGGNFEAMAISGITRFSVCAAGVSSKVGQKLTRTSHKGTKAIEAITGLTMAKRAPQGFRFDFAFQIRSFI